MSKGLTDYNGKVMKIKKVGAVYPVDVELYQKDDKNILSISVSVKFLMCDSSEPEKLEAWKEAIINGFKEWAGEYRVFGGQQLTVTVDVYETDRFLDCIFVNCLDESLKEYMSNTSGKRNAKVKLFIDNNRSFTCAKFPLIGWKSYLMRSIYMMPKTINDLEDAKKVAKHEFGHVLGLGDLYRDLSIGLCGVEGAEYSDIEPYYLGNHMFDMVMCNEGPVRDNDIEMVLLAFQTNCCQEYQSKKRSKVSKALGTGN